jgi:uncharacterized membrane protein YphA (DoxX/SURF4 family)
MNRTEEYGQLFARVAIGAGFLSAVADRFGLWGQAGEKGVAWGNFEAFTAYVAKLNWFAPDVAIPLLAWMATGAEVVLAVALIAGVSTRLAAAASSLLLLSFAVTMTMAFGPKGPLDYSVFAAAAGALLLATCDRYAWSIDGVRERSHGEVSLP